MIKGSLTFSVSGETLKRPEVTAAVIWCYMDKTNELSHIELFITLREARSGPNTGPGRLWRRVTVLLLNTGWGASVNCPILSLHLFTKVKGVFCCFKTQSQCFQSNLTAWQALMSYRQKAWNNPEVTHKKTTMNGRKNEQTQAALQRRWNDLASWEGNIGSYTEEGNWLIVHRCGPRRTKV